MNPTPDPAAGSRYQLWFSPLPKSTSAPRAFRCDAAGHIDLDALSDHDRGEYLFARALVGRDFARPAVQRNASHPLQRLAAADINSSRTAQ
ncbi:MAG: hypothetical protein KA151_02260 [Piscinibacter sp.]|nr:hypothetical protein [Piscinibacter sp.]